MDKRSRELCFKGAHAVDLGKANQQHWYLVTGAAGRALRGRGDRAAARYYVPPNVALNTVS